MNFAVYDEQHFKIEPEGLRLPDQVIEVMRSMPRARQHRELFYVPLRSYEKVRARARALSLRRRARSRAAHDHLRRRSLALGRC